MSDDVLRLALPGFDVKRGKVDEQILDSRYSSPKIDTQAQPPHAGIIFLNWNRTAGINGDTTLILYQFPHGFKGKIPAVFASYLFDNGSTRIRGTLPFQFGALGMIVLDADEENVYLKYYSIDISIPATTIVPFIMQLRFYVMAELGY